MKQCTDCKTFKKGENCIRCAMKYKKEADEAREEASEARDAARTALDMAIKADGALNAIANVFGEGKNDNSKLILIEGILQAYTGRK